MVDEKYYINPKMYDGTNNGEVVTPVLERVDNGYKCLNATALGYDIATIGDTICFDQPSSKTRRGRVGHNLSQTLQVKCGQGVVCYDYRIRKLTPTESFRLQGFTDKDVKVLIDNGLSDNRIYKLAGNSITVNVLEYIFKSLLRNEIQQSEKQLSVFDLM